MIQQSQDIRVMTEETMNQHMRWEIICHRELDVQEWPISSIGLECYSSHKLRTQVTLPIELTQHCVLRSLNFNEQLFRLECIHQ